MKVSVIVPNHGRDLTTLKASLPWWVELLVIDRGFERSKQRNMGILEATGDFFLFLDSDHSISPGLIEECCGLVLDGYNSIYIPEVIVAKSFFGKVRNFEREFYTGTAIDVPRFVVKKACPFFDERLHGPEDSDWGNRIKGKRAISRQVLYHHDDISIREYFSKKAYYAKSLVRYRRKWPNDKCLKFSYRCWGVFVENGKWKKLVRHPVFSFCIFLIVLVRGIIYVKTTLFHRHRHA
jgi:glycosyltransferase involved in cell wall biosynthesis